MNDLNSVKNINRGGCGTAALLMFRKLRDLGYKPSIVMGFRDDYWGYEENLNYKNGLPVSPESAAHVWIRLNNLSFDCESTAPKRRYLIDRTLIVPEFQLVHSLACGTWNPDFKRKSIIPVAKRHGIFIEDVENILLK